MKDHNIDQLGQNGTPFSRRAFLLKSGCVSLGATVFALQGFRIGASADETGGSSGQRLPHYTLYDTPACKGSKHCGSKAAGSAEAVNTVIGFMSGNATEVETVEAIFTNPVPDGRVIKVPVTDPVGNCVFWVADDANNEQGPGTLIWDVPATRVKAFITKEG